MDHDKNAGENIHCVTGNTHGADSLEKYRMMFETARDMIFFYCMDGQIIDVNEAVVLAYGYTHEELLHMNIADLRIPEERPKIKKQTQECCSGPCLFETVHQRKDGSTFPVEITARCLFFGQDMLAAIVRNISERKKVEKFLEKNRAILARAQKIAHVGNWAWNLKNNTLQWSDEIFAILGFNPQELQPTYEWFLDRVFPDDRELFIRSLNIAIRENKLFNIDCRVMRPDGSIRYLNIVADRIKKDRSGTPEWMYGIVQDITRRKLVENKLRDAQEQAELYVDLMGHDINNMNMVAMGFLELAYNKLESEGKLDKSDEYLIKKPIDNLENSSMLIDNVRKLQREKAGELKIKAIDVGEVLTSVKDQFVNIPNRAITINLNKKCQCTVLANDLLRDVFTNLVGNSIKHSSGPLTINIELTCPHENSSNFCKVVVEDNGPGIPDAMKAVLLDRSQRGQKGHSKGLGLYIVNTLVEDFHGKVWIEDRVAGDSKKGARFVVVLPAVE